MVQARRSTRASIKLTLDSNPNHQKSTESISTMSFSKSPIEARTKTTEMDNSELFIDALNKSGKRGMSKNAYKRGNTMS